MAKTPINPMPEYVVAQKAKVKEKTTSGLYLPSSPKQKYNIAKVISVGAGINEVEIGQWVIFKNDFSAVPAPSNGEEYLIIHKSDIVANAEAKWAGE